MHDLVEHAPVVCVIRSLVNVCERNAREFPCLLLDCHSFGVMKPNEINCIMGESDEKGCRNSRECGQPVSPSRLTAKVAE